jgi:hypothetical protein
MASYIHANRQNKTVHGQGEGPALVGKVPIRVRLDPQFLRTSPRQRHAGFGSRPYPLAPPLAGLLTGPGGEAPRNLRSGSPRLHHGKGYGHATIFLTIDRS